MTETYVNHSPKWESAMFTLTDGRNVTVATEMDRTGTVPCLSIREAGVMGHAPLLASMPRHHVSAPILSALGFSESDAQRLAAYAGQPLSLVAVQGRD